MIYAYINNEDENDMNKVEKQLEVLTPEQVVLKYGQYLKEQNQQHIIALYHENAEIIPDQLASLSGTEKIIEFYQQTFQNIRIDGDLKITSSDIGADWAIIRCEEPAQVTDLATGITSSGYFREMFVLKRMENKWFIYKYMFSQNNNQVI